MEFEFVHNFNSSGSSVHDSQEVGISVPHLLSNSNNFPEELVFQCISTIDLPSNADFPDKYSSTICIFSAFVNASFK